MNEINKELLKAVARKDRRAELELYNLCFSLLMSVTIRYRLNSDRSGELINDAFVKAVSNLNQFNPKRSSFYAWIKTIMINTVIDDFRKQNANREISKNGNQLEFVINDYAYNDYVKDENIREILRQLEFLAPATRYVFNLIAIEGYSHKEVAEQLGISRETTKWHMKQARRLLNEKFGVSKKLKIGL